MTFTVDTHFHAFDPNKFQYYWMNGQSTKPIERTILPDELLPILFQHNISKAVLVQALNSEEEVPFLLDQSDHYPFIAGVVIWLNMEDENFEDHLLKYQSNPKFLGIRPMVQDIEDSHWLLKPSVLKALEILQKYDKSFDILIKHHQLPIAIEIVKKFPNLRFVIDHIAKPSIHQQEMEPWQSHMREIASYRNVFCKLSGMITEADPEKKGEDIKPFVDIVVDAFGYDRLMFGSDWPVCLLAGDYDQVIQTLRKCLGNISKENEKKIFGENAVKFYKLA